MVLVIDNYDSFTYNIVQYLRELGADVDIELNDRISVAGIRERRPTHLVISPGPCTPAEAGVSVPAIAALAAEMPILGVCLGHQCIGAAMGLDIMHARRIMHGKTSVIHNAGMGVFSGLPAAFNATRYHSLVVDSSKMPASLLISAWSCRDGGEFDEIMGLKHRTLPLEGVQFHPESILSECGHALLANFLKQ